MTCGVEKALKVWNKSVQSCHYTIETHQPVHTMAITGEKSDLLVASIGDGDLIVYGLELKNQLSIIEQAHKSRVIQIVSLNKLNDKYYATRCVDGHLIIWAATKQPDKLFTIENADRDQQTDISHIGQQIIGEDQNPYTSQATGLVASERDRMIELKWKFAISSSSTTVLCYFNFNAQRTFIATMELKTKRKIIIKTFNNQRSPT